MFEWPHNARGINSPSHNAIPMPLTTQFTAMDNSQLFDDIQRVNVPRYSAELCRLNLKAQAKLQTQQIDSAIQLLKMQYDAIMQSVHKTQSVPPSSGKGQVAHNQTSFAAQFALPLTTDSELAAVYTSMSMEAKISRKRHSCDKDHTDDISISNLLVHSKNCPDIRIQQSVQAKKRAR